MSAQITTNQQGDKEIGAPIAKSETMVSAPEGELVADAPPKPVETEPAKPRRPRGFAAMDRKLVSEIARKGGKAAHTAGTAHEFTSDEARAAGSKGGRATHAKRRRSGAEQQG